MKRPLLLRLLPDRAALSLTARRYRRQHAFYRDLYQYAELRHARGVRMDLVPGDVISDSIAFVGVYEPAVSRRVCELAQRGGLLIDVGANLGYFSLLWLASHPTNRVMAFEAAPRNVQLLRANVERNGFQDRIQVIPCGAGNAPGQLHFDPGPEDQTGWGGFSSADTPGSFAIDVVRVDDMVPADTEVALLKVDIEGADTWALQGCEKLLRARLVREVWFEQNKSRMRALGIPENAPIEYLQSVGYEPTPLGNTDSQLVEWSAIPSAKS